MTEPDRLERLDRSERLDRLAAYSRLDGNDLGWIHSDVHVKRGHRCVADWIRYVWMKFSTSANWMKHRARGLA
jgi:hypothetical protein